VASAFWSEIDMRRRLTVPRPLAYFLIAVLALFETGVVVLVLHPDVSDLYRAYYIERSTSCWPRKVTGVYQPNRLISFAYGVKGGSAEDVQLCGWNLLEGMGTWTLGDDVRLRLGVPVPGKPFSLILTAEAFVSAENPVQRVIVSVGGKTVKSFIHTTTDPLATRIDIPAEVVPPGARTIDVKLGLPDALAPLAINLNTDGRELALRVISVQVVTDDPVRRRPKKGATS
jgi:hypothetical protein